MQKFKIELYSEAISDFKFALEYYESINSKLSKKFKAATNTAFNDLKKNPFYEIRYDDFRLKQIKKFPYLIHFVVNENAQTVYVYGIRNTNQNPDTSYFVKK